MGKEEWPLTPELLHHDPSIVDAWTRLPTRRRILFADNPNRDL
jgi:hypothetical protein